jgi:hypothetical protein
LSDWEPATEAEAAMLGALAMSDQEQYFRILAGSELLLPVSAETMAGRTPMGWGTWTTGNRTHVLAFTSGSALFACLNEPGGSYRKVPFHELATDWPNYEWWLAVNPGLPIEAYLPSWFVAQLTRGDVRLPGRALGARARMAQSDLAAALSGRVRASAPAPTVTAPTHAPTQANRGVIPTVVTTPGADPLNGRYPLLETIDAEIIDSPPLATAAPLTASAPTSPVGPPFAASARVPSSNTYASEAFLAARADSGATPAWEPRAAVRIEPEDAEVVSSLSTGPARVSAPAESLPGGSAPGVDRLAIDFSPANETEANLLAAAAENNTDGFLSTLLLAQVILPVAPGTPRTARPTDPNFPWQINDMDGQRYLSVFTSPERLAEHDASQSDTDIASVTMRFIQLIGAWPDEDISFAVNPGSPVGATLPGAQIVALASWAAEVGLHDDPADGVVGAKKTTSTPVSSVAGEPAAGAGRATLMQRTVPPSQLPYYLERGYDRVSGFVHRAGEVAHLTTPRMLLRALGLARSGSPFSEDDAEVHVLRWVAYRADLYRIPYGGQHEAGMRAMQGWVIERAPFRGNGFAPGDADVIAEFKVDSVRLPHGAQMWRLRSDGAENLVAIFDADAGRWVSTETSGADRFGGGLGA